MDKQNYYLGLDMGVSSIGWAVTDESYNLIRKKRKDLWGIREFDEAKTSAERRSYRVSRRRRQREIARLGLVKDYFADAINEVDPNFYARLENSKYHLEDKDEDVRTPNAIFNDADYQDKDYYEEFPTIFHLRQELIRNKDPHDVRLVYLAISNMFKHRGHFLNAGLTSDSGTVNMQAAYQALLVALDEFGEGLSFPSVDDTSVITEILSDRTISRTVKKERLTEFFGFSKNEKAEIEMIKAFCGLSVDCKKLFADLDAEGKPKFEFNAAFEDKEAELTDIVGENRFEIILAAKAVYESGALAGILKGYEYLSDARVASYEKHRDDLKILKKAVRSYCSKEYYGLFRSDEAGSYSAYVNSVNSRHSSDNDSGQKRRNMKNRSADDFYSNVKKLFKGMEDKPEVKYILNEIDNNNFMPKQLTSQNGIIPNQVHAKELRAILNNAQEYLAFLNEADESGLTTSERIIQLFSFQIPYYVGPVTSRSEDPKGNDRKGNGWVIRKEGGRVLPWNIQDKIDLTATEETFINRMVRRCTYMSGEQVLPRKSLMYERFCVLNEINNIKIDGVRIEDVSLKQDIFSLFKKNKKVTRKKVFEYLKNRGVVSSDDQISGIDININNDLSTYHKFYSIFGDELETDQCKAMVEEIVRLCTIFGESKALLREKLSSEFGLDDSIVKRITGLKFKEWGNLSKKFLELEGVDKETGEVMSLIGALWVTNKNMMELLNDTFKEEMENLRNTSFNSLSDITPESLNEFYFSAPVRKMINQTIKVMREIEHVMGCPPSRVFIEMARDRDEDPSRTISRAKQMNDLYASITDMPKEERKYWKELINAENTSGRIKSKKMYLYIKQMGKDLYTGKPIDLDKLFDDDLYDIDHIYPRHFVKDDNLENNLVLVNKPDNAGKLDIYPLSPDIRSNPSVINLWRSLRANGLMNEEKYNRLTCSKPFTEEQLAGFIARQLVETRQGTKGIADLLKQAMPASTEIVYAKASNVSAFRQQFNIPKSRLLNEFHHAHDAYLNIVVGNVYFTKFTKDPLNYIRNEYRVDEKKNNYNLYRMFEKDVQRGGKTAWMAPSFDKKTRSDNNAGTIGVVRKSMSKNTPIMTRQAFQVTGGIADQQIIGKDNAKNGVYLPVKSSDEKLADVEKYGGFNKPSGAYFFAVEHTDNRDNRIRTIEYIPIWIAGNIKNGDITLSDYCSQYLGLKEHRIIVRKIGVQSLLLVNGFPVYVSGRTGDRLVLWNAANLCINNKWTGYIKRIESGKYGELEKDMNIKLFDELLDKYCNSLYSKLSSAVGGILSKGRDQYVRLDLETQGKCLAEILKLSSIGAASADLKAIGGSGRSGILTISKKISNYDSVYLLQQSAAGLLEKRIDLLSI